MKKLEKLQILLAILILLIGFLSQGFAPRDGFKVQYKNNLKVMSLNTSIKYVDENQNDIEIKGNVLKFIEDPLTMYVNGEKELFAGDDYNLISQDDHGIYKNEELLFQVNGKIKILGDKYYVYNKQNRKIAHVDFNWADTIGKMYDEDGKLIAQYNSKFLFKDYKITIYENNLFENKEVQMIFASYISDKEAD